MPALAGRGGKVVLAFAGDTNFEDGGAADPAARVAPFSEILKAADFAMVNLESALGTGGTPVPKDFVFQAPPSVLAGLAEVGVDAVSMANNHGMDHGTEGLAESLAAKADAPIPVLGIGANEDEAFKPLLFTVNRTRIAVIAATQVLDSNLINAWTATAEQGGLASAKRVDTLVTKVFQAKLKADTVVVFLHWGVEQQECPTVDQQTLAATLESAGADVIIGSHAHRLQGGGRLKTAIVHYGLGNFGFLAKRENAKSTGVFEVTIEAGEPTGYRWVPGRIDGSTPRPVQGDEADTARGDVGAAARLHGARPVAHRARKPQGRGCPHPHPVVG